VQGLRIHGRVVITGNNCTLQGCEIVGQAGIAYDTTSDYGLVSSSGTGNTVQYNHLTQYDPSTSTDNSVWWMVGVLMTGGSCTVYRNDIHDTNDLTYTTGGTHQILGNFLHEPGFRTDDQDQSGSSPAFWSHNDGFQIMGGTNHLVDGNNFVMKFSTLTGMNSTANPNPNVEQQWPNCHGMIVQNNKNALSGITIQRNWFKYGTNALFLGSGGTFDPGIGPTCLNNRFTPDQGKQFSLYRQIVITPTTSWSVQPSVDNTNVYSDDTDTPISVQGLPLNGNFISDGTSSNPSTVGGVTAWTYDQNTHTGNIPFSLTSP
jgi:hypothetical protein